MKNKNAIKVEIKVCLPNIGTEKEPGAGIQGKGGLNRELRNE